MGEMSELGEQAMRRFFAIFKDDQGATAIEYGLILAMVFLAMIVAFRTSPPRRSTCGDMSRTK
jgi:Flp pilus assembly protein TadG